MKKKKRLLIPGLLIGACALTVFIKRGEIRGYIQGLWEQEGKNDELPDMSGNAVDQGSGEVAQVWSGDQARSMKAGDILDVSALDDSAVSGLFYSEAIDSVVLSRIDGISYRENEDVSLEELRYLRILYMGFDGETHIGELIVNEKIAGDVLDIMGELYANAYPIEKMMLIDEYGGDDNESMADNNSSAFNYRVIAGTSRMSKHSLGMAVDINPRYNPYIRTGENGETIVDPENGSSYADRSQEFDHKIDENDLCHQLFTEHGFTWGGSWNSVKDYQHFQKVME